MKYKAHKSLEVMCEDLYLSQGLPEHSILPRVWPVCDKDPAILPCFSDCFDLKVVYLLGLGRVL